MVCGARRVRRLVHAAARVAGGVQVLVPPPQCFATY